MAGDFKACRQAIDLLRKEFYEGRPPLDVERELRIAVKACTLKPKDGCGALAGQFSLGRGVPKDISVRDWILADLCAAGDDSACSSLCRELRIRPEELQLAHGYCRRACKRGDQLSCKDWRKLPPTTKPPALLARTSKPAALIAVLAGADQPTWGEIRDMGEGAITNIHRTGGELYAVARSGLRKSTDGGATWQTLSNAMLGDALQLPDQALILHGEYGSVFRQEPGAQPRAVIEDRKNPVQAIWNTGATIIAVGQAGIVRRSDDGGATFSIVRPADTSSLRAVRGSGDLIYAGGTVMLRSTDGGKNWSQLGSTLDKPVGSLFVTSAGTVLRCRRGGVVEQSSDRGDTWTRIDVPHTIDMCGFAEVGQRVFLTTAVRRRQKVGSYQPYLAESRDGGKSFTAFEVPMDGTLFTLEALSDGRLIAGGGTGPLAHQGRMLIITPNRRDN